MNIRNLTTLSGLIGLVSLFCFVSADVRALTSQNATPVVLSSTDMAVKRNCELTKYQ